MHSIPIRVVVVLVVLAWHGAAPTTFAQGEQKGPPNVLWGIDFAKERGWSIKGAQGEYFRVGQGAAIEGKDVVSVAIYASLPFAAAPMQVDGELRDHITVRIARVEKGFLIPVDEGDVVRRMVPVREQLDPQTGTLKTKLLTHAAKYSWQFVNKGTSFEVDGTTYIAEKEAAIISFTKDGIGMEGITKLKKPEAKQAKNAVRE